MLEYEILASFSLNFNDMIFSPNFISNRDQLSLISEKKERTSEVIGNENSVYSVYCSVFHRTQQNTNKSRNLRINDKLLHLKLSIYRLYCNLFIFCHSLFCVSTIPKPTGFLLKPSSLCLEGEI